MQYSHQEIQEKVIQAIGVSLAMEADEIRDDSRLIEDLGMDSLDFLDIMFNLEKEFKTKIRDEDFNRVLRPNRSDETLEEEFLTADEIARLAPMIPALEAAAEKEKIPRRDLFSYLTVDALVRMVRRKVG